MNDIFAALANPIRRDILVRLRRGPQAVSELAERFDIGRPAVSEHLQILKKAKLVRLEPRGQKKYYHLDPRPLGGVEAWLKAFDRYWNDRLDALKDLLDAEKEKS